MSMSLRPDEGTPEVNRIQSHADQTPQDMKPHSRFPNKMADREQ